MPAPAPALPNSQHQRRRVAITGLGAVSSLGTSVADFWQGLVQGRSGIAPISLVNTSELRFKNGAEVAGYDPAANFPKGAELLDRFAQFAVMAAREAVADSKLRFTPEIQSRTAVVTGSSVGGKTTEDDAFRQLYRDASPRVPPFTIPRAMANASASHIAIDLGLTGPGFTLSTACSSANHALGLAYWMVANGISDLAIAGGSEAPFSYGLLKAWEAMRVISPDTCRPFSKDRRGMILGEGAAMLMLEPLENARARGAHIHAEITGFGMSSDAHHTTAGNVEGPVAAMSMAMHDGGIEPVQVGYINAHGTGTPLNDATESSAINAAFGGYAKNILVSSTKAAHGHALGAAGALEAVATVLALENQLLPPTCNFTQPDPACEVNVIANEAKPAQVEYALSNSFAFGGLNAVVLFRRFQPVRGAG